MALSIAIIPARGGSKRLPKKNIKQFCGKPLIVWSIEAAIEYGKFDLVIVSTDSKEIAEVATLAGAYVPFIRPASIANDAATTDDVVLHAVNWLEKVEQKEVGLVTLLQPTSPLRDASDIREAMNLYNIKNAEAVISVCELDHPIQYCNRLPEDLSMSEFLPNNVPSRSQELSTYYRLNGAIYIFQRKYAENLRNMYSAFSYAYVMDRVKSIDIDTEYDFFIAECIKKLLKNNI